MNQHETGTSSAIFDPVGRRKAELDSMGVPDDVHGAARPQYGYLSAKNFAYPDSNKSEGEAVDGYGHIVIRFKDQVRERSTVTFGDSWRLQSNDLGQASPLGSVGHQSIAAQDLAGAGDGVLDSYDAWRAKENMPYIEAQIQDGLSVDDIADVRFHRSQPPPPEMEALLKQRGIAWEYYG